MESVEPGRKPRKSRFDVAPDDAYVASAAKIDCLSATSSSFFTTEISILPRQQEYNNPSELVAASASSWIPVTDAAFTTRLQNALRRNFEKESNQGQDSVISGNASRGSVLSHKLQQRVRSAGAARVAKPGIGLASSSGAYGTAVPSNQESSSIVSVYVSGLPSDITEEDLDILFSVQGKIKKIKLYVDSQGKKKGDALVTFAKSESVSLAIRQFNGRDIGEGCILSVNKADFGSKAAPTQQNKLLQSTYGPAGMMEVVGSQSASTSPVYLSSVTATASAPSSSSSSTSSSSRVPGAEASSLNDGQSFSSMFLHSYEDSLLRASLPSECEAHVHPIALLWDVFDPNALPPEEHAALKFFSDLEADLLLECCRHGRIVRIVTPPPAPPPSLFDAGCVVVTYAEGEAALVCVRTLHGRKFDGRRLSARALLLQPPLSEVLPIDSRSEGGVSPANMENTIAHNDNNIVETGDTHEAKDVEDFLNSLL